MVVPRTESVNVSQIESQSVQAVLQEITIKTVCDRLNVHRSVLFSPTRKREVVFPRQVVSYLLSKNPKIKISQESIGKLMGGKDHSTINYSNNVIAGLMFTDKAIKAQVLELQDYINQY